MTITVLFIGDVVGRPGRRALMERLPAILKKHRPELVIANIENAAGGSGLTVKSFNELDGIGIDVFTSGNHIWHKKEVFKILKKDRRVLRPLNYHKRAPGTGCGVFEGKNGHKIGVINLAGMAFMDTMLYGSSPFDAVETALAQVGAETHVSIVDIHAETTSEKQALAWYVNGRASAVIGTHTHVQTADERILPGGTAYISDAGMTGPIDSVIGMSRKIIIEKFLTGIPERFEVARSGPVIICGVAIKIRYGTGRALSIERLQEAWHQ